MTWNILCAKNSDSTGNNQNLTVENASLWMWLGREKYFYIINDKNFREN